MFTTRRRTAMIAAPAVTAAAIGLLAPAPAHASDGYTTGTVGGGYTAWGTYDDGTDNLCIRLESGTPSGRPTRARIVRQNGSGPNFSVKRSAGGTSCTGNLSIPEDQPYLLRLETYSSGSLSWVTLDTDSFYS